ncbi:MAG: sodium-dependent bicarbonate transport family permease [Verrucomicrobiota bacterium]|nr:sodium-dependent bicarbonate transport family permease [Verrucomicrobiota bacterium]
MIDNLLNPAVLFFVLGLVAGILKSDLKVPQALYESLSLYLLIVIGMKGGVELSKTSIQSIGLPVMGALALGIVIPLVAYAILKYVGKFSVPDAAAIAAHYGSVSAVTYAVCLSFLQKMNVPFEGFSAVLLVTMEVPAIVVAIMIARLYRSKTQALPWGKFFHEVFLSKSIVLLVGGLIIGVVVGDAGMEPVKNVFFDPFKGLLAFFLLEMGLVASSRIKDLKKVGVFLVLFGIGMPLISALIGCWIGKFTGLSVGGTTILATLAASASYIAAPAAVRIAIPEANPSYYLTASLAITFPFNLTIGLPLYYKWAQWIVGKAGG